MKKTFLYLIFYISIQSTFAQNIFQHLKVEHWDTKKGMPSDLALSLFQSSDGFIWMTSYSGFTRFDGVNFTNFNTNNLPLLHSNNVNQIFESSDKTLWFTTPNSGLLAYKNGNFKQYLSNYNLTHSYFGQDKILSYIPSQSNYVLFDTQTLKEEALDSAKFWQAVVNDKIILNNYQDQSGNKWIRFIRNVYKIGKDNKVVHLGAKEGVEKNLEFSSLFVDSKKRVWLTSIKGLYLWNGEKIVPIPEFKDKLFPPLASFINLILEDRSGGIWVACKGGLAYLSPKSNQFIFSPAGFFNQDLNNIFGIIEDKEGNIWVASEGYGLYKLSFSKFKNFFKPDGSLHTERVSAVLALDSNKYIISGSVFQQLSLIDNGKVLPYQFKNPKLANYRDEALYLFQDSKTNIWVCGQRYLLKINSQGEEKIIAEGQALRYIFEDKQKKLWFALPSKGIAYLNEKEELEILKIPFFNFKTWFISSIRRLNNEQWLVCSYNLGIVLLDFQKNKATVFNEKNGLNTTTIFSSYEDADNTVWLATNLGISRYKQNRWQHIGFKDGLPENAIFECLPDKQGYWWLTSAKGLIRVKKQALIDYLDKKINKIDWQLYDNGDGMINRQCVGARHSTVSPDGKILATTQGGLAEINPAKLFKNQIPPSVVIHKLLWDDKEQDLANLQLTPGSHRFIFEYSGLSLVAPEKVKFKFRLMGYDKDWINATGDRRAFYTNLPSGTYTFQVIACNNDGIWNEKGASLNFTILPFFYETWWFRLLSLGLLFAGIFGFIRWRTYSIRQKNKLLEAKVAERTQQLKDTNEELYQTNEELKSTVELVEKERQKSDNLLLNILPEETAQELKETGTAKPKHYDLVSVLFTDFKGFTKAVEHLKPIEVIKELDYCFNKFDEIIEKYGLERIKTIGDAYMAVGGLPLANQTNPIDAVRAGLEIQQFMNELKLQRKSEGKTAWQCRLGIHSGEVIAGVVGTKKFAYDIWGDAVNLASRMESSGEVGKVNISGTTYQLVKDQFECTYRGKIEAKNKGEVEMYFVESVL